VISVRGLLGALLARYGAQGWWPGEGAFEVMTSAVLVQRTAWRNVELALEALRGARIDTWEQLAATRTADLQSLIRSAGFYRLKAQRLMQLAQFVLAAGGLEALGRLRTAPLRDSLLSVHGIGPETADAILLYAFERPVFVIDAYARQLFTRFGGASVADEVLRRRALRALPRAADLNELHALIVAHGKRHCGAKPSCERCVLVSRCAHGAHVRAGSRNACRTSRGSRRPADTDMAP
jgi:endonuclease III related protein